MAQINQLGPIVPVYVTCKNYQSADIAAGTCVMLDTSNTPAGSGTAPLGVLTTSGSTVAPFGIAAETLVAGKTGRVQISGVGVGIAGGTVHVGDAVMSDSTGELLDATTGKYAIGFAMSEAADENDLLVLIDRHVWTTVS